MIPRELFEIVKKNRAETCFMPLFKSRKHKPEALISVESLDHKSYLIENPIMIGDYEVCFIDAQQKLCYICKNSNHITKDCQIGQIRYQQWEKRRQNFQRYGRNIKRFQLNFYNSLNKQFGHPQRREIDNRR